MILFPRKIERGTTILILYVDDIASITTLKSSFNQHFEMKYLGHLKYFLGLEVSTSLYGYYLTQGKYVYNLLFRKGLTNSKIVTTLFVPNTKFTTTDDNLL